MELGLQTQPRAFRPRLQSPPSLKHEHAHGWPQGTLQRTGAGWGPKWWVRPVDASVILSFQDLPRGLEVGPNQKRVILYFVDGAWTDLVLQRHTWLYIIAKC